jgi:mycoredoxin
MDQATSQPADKPDEKIVIYGTEWCGDCRRARRFLDQHNILYQWINIDRDKQAEQFVLNSNGGMRSVPTIVFPDHSILVEPSSYRLAEKLGIENL